MKEQIKKQNAVIEICITVYIAQYMKKKVVFLFLTYS